MNSLTVATFNIQHGRNHNLQGDVLDFGLMAQTVASTGASVFGFNEVRCGAAGEDIPGFPDTPAILGGLLGGEAVFGRAITLGEGKHYGNALVSKLPVLSHEVIPIPDPSPKSGRRYYESRCIIKTVVDCGEREAVILNSHFGLNPDERRNAVKTVFDAIKGCDMPVILMGDFNMTPDDPCYAALACEFTDSAAFAGTDCATFPSDAPKDRIDYIFVRGAAVIGSHTVQKVASDHFAVSAEVVFDK